jgi:hypothetical protein
MVYMDNNPTIIRYNVIRYSLSLFTQGKSASFLVYLMVAFQLSYIHFNGLQFVLILDYVDSNGSPCPNGKVLMTTTLPQDPVTHVKVCGKFIIA